MWGRGGGGAGPYNVPLTVSTITSNCWSGYGYRNSWVLSVVSIDPGNMFGSIVSCWYASL